MSAEAIGDYIRGCRNQHNQQSYNSKQNFLSQGHKLSLRLKVKSVKFKSRKKQYTPRLLTLDSCHWILKKMFSKKTLFRLLINTAIGAVLIFFWLKLVNLEEILKELRKVNLFAVLPFVIFFALAGALRGIRLKYLLKEFKIPTLRMVALNYFSQLLSFMIPLRLGEIAKGVYLSTEYNLPASKALVWVFMDRFIDFWVVLLSSLILLLLIPTNLPANLGLVLIILIGLFSFAGAVAIFFPTFGRKIIGIIKHIFVFNRLKEIFEKVSHFLLDSASFLNKGFKGTLIIVFLSLLSYIAEALGWYTLFLAVFKGADFLKLLLGTLLTVLTYIIPAAPGYVGSAEAAILAVFSLGLGYDRTLVSVATLISHALTLICILIFGFISLYFLKFDLSLVWKKLKGQED